MPYSAGSTHAIAGSGAVAVSNPIGLKVSVSNIPSTLTLQFTTPLEYYHLGAVSLGNADGTLPELEIKYALQLFYPLPDFMTTLNYNLIPGVTGVVEELLPVALANNQLAPWDRGATLYEQTFAVSAAGGGALTTAWTYTVPAGKWLGLEAVDLFIARTAVATAVSLVTAYLLINAAVFKQAQLQTTNAVGDQVDAQMTGPILLPAGTVLSAQYRNRDTGGSANVSLQAIGLIFNA